MREFENPQSRVRALSTPAKALYSVFAGFTLLGELSEIGLYHGIVRFSARATPRELYDRLVAHYDAGPPSSYTHLLEVTHAHLFSVPIYLLVAGHLFFLTGLSQRAKLWWICAASAATFLHLLAPWAVRFSGGALAWAYPITGLAFLGTMTTLLGVPVWEMWRPARMRETRP